MSYKYEDQKEWLFSEKGLIAVMAVARQARNMGEVSGAFTCQKLMDAVPTPHDSWQALACVDFLCRTEQICMLWDGGATQDRIFVIGKLNQ